MEFGELVEGEFLERVNRFVCRVKVGKEETTALLRNTGRLRELLVEGAKVFLREKSTGKHGFELILVEAEGGLVCVDSHLPPKLLVEYLSRSSHPWELKEYRYEPRVGGSRFDLLLNGSVLVETKSVNLVKNSVALFPDAPTQRGERHVRELIELSKRYEPAVVFVVQRSDAIVFSPNWDTDPDFSKALREFYELGFTVKAFLCEVSTKEIYIKKDIPVKI